MNVDISIKTCIVTRVSVLHECVVGDKLWDVHFCTSECVTRTWECLAWVSVLHEWECCHRHKLWDVHSYTSKSILEKSIVLFLSKMTKACVTKIPGFGIYLRMDFVRKLASHCRNLAPRSHSVTGNVRSCNVRQYTIFQWLLKKGCGNAWHFSEGLIFARLVGNMERL